MLDSILLTLRRLLAPHPAVTRLQIAYSGGLDSTVLLHRLSQLPALPFSLTAVHVDHGWRAESAQWARHCVEYAGRCGISCTLLTVAGRPAPGESPEAAARAARYAALAAQADATSAILTAHHADDQAETLLLQLLRGAGPKGLAAMPEAARLGEGWHWRPLLAETRASLQAYADAQGLDWLDDPANDSLAFDRNWLRADIMPRLLARFPAARTTLARSARLCAEAADLVDMLAASHLETLAHTDGTLDAGGLLALDTARASAVVRLWLQRLGLPVPAAAPLAAALRAMATAHGDALPVARWPGAEMRRFRGRCYAFKPLAPPPQGRVDWSSATPAPLDLPDQSRLRWVPSIGAGVRANFFADQRPLHVAWRHGGERFQPAGRAHSQTLKKLLQEAGMLPWWRERLPLVWCDSTLVAVPGLGPGASLAAREGEPGRVLQWQTPDASATI